MCQILHFHFVQYIWSFDFNLFVTIVVIVGFVVFVVTVHMGPENASREKKLTMVNFLIFVQKNVSTIRFQEMKIRPLKGFEKMRFLCFYIIAV